MKFLASTVVEKILLASSETWSTFLRLDKHIELALASFLIHCLYKAGFKKKEFCRYRRKAITSMDVFDQ